MTSLFWYQHCFAAWIHQKAGRKTFPRRYHLGGIKWLLTISDHTTFSFIILTLGSRFDDGSVCSFDFYFYAHVFLLDTNMYQLWTRIGPKLMVAILWNWLYPIFIMGELFRNVILKKCPRKKTHLQKAPRIKRQMDQIRGKHPVLYSRLQARFHTRLSLKVDFSSLSWSTDLLVLWTTFCFLSLVKMPMYLKVSMTLQLTTMFY